MADSEHLNKLRGELNDWNEWRKDNPETNPDLRSAPLQGADLINANLSGANLSGADLNGAELHSVNFNEANLALADRVGRFVQGSSGKLPGKEKGHGVSLTP